MRAFRAHRRLFSWIAVFAVLLASLAPSLSHALGSDSGAPWIEVCTSQGSKWMAETQDDSPTAPAASHVFEHCPFCSMHAPNLGLPPSADTAPLLIEGHSDFPSAFYAVPRTLHAWVSAQPRAPPKVS